MRLLRLLPILFLLSAPVVDAKNCHELMEAILGTSKHSKSPSPSKALDGQGYQELESFFNSLDGIITLDTVDRLFPYELFKNVFLRDEFVHQIAKWSGHKFSEINLAEITEVILLKLGESHKNLKTLPDYWNDVKDFFPRYWRIIFLEHYQVEGKLMLTSKQAFKLADAEASEIIFHALVNQAERLKHVDDLPSVFKHWREYKLTSRHIKKLFEQSSLFKSIDDPEYQAYIRQILTKNSDLGDRSIVQNLRKVIDIYFGRGSSELTTMTNPLEFFAYLKMHQKADKSFSVPMAFSQSPYAKRVGITPRLIQKFLKRVRETTPITIADYAEIASDVWNRGARHKRFDIPVRYDVEVEFVGVRNQCQSGSCWVQAGMARVEREIADVLGEEVELSTDYAYGRYLRDQAKDMLEDHMNLDPEGYTKGGFQNKFMDILRHYGVIPKSALPENYVLFRNNNNNIIMNSVAELIKRFKLEVSRNSGLPEELFNIWIKDRKVELRKEIDSIFDQNLGPIPTSFTFKGVDYSPATFYKKFYRYFNEKLVVITNNSPFAYERGNNFKKTINLFGNGRVLTKETPMSLAKVKKEEFLDDIIIKSIDKNRPVRVSLYWRREVETESGKMVKIIDYDTGIMSVPAGEVIKREDKHTHAVLIIGYELDVNGNLKTLKVLNSHGKESGDGGIFHMDVSYLRKCLRGIVVQESDGLAWNNHRPSHHILFQGRSLLLLA